jgi:hypothetical protein
MIHIEKIEIEYKISEINARQGIISFSIFGSLKGISKTITASFLWNFYILFQRNICLSIMIISAELFCILALIDAIMCTCAMSGLCRIACCCCCCSIEMA